MPQRDIHIATLQKVVARGIEGDGGVLEEKEQDHRGCLRVEKQAREERDETSVTLYGVLMKARKTIEAHGAGTSSLYVGLDPGLVADSLGSRIEGLKHTGPVRVSAPWRSSSAV